MPKPLILFLKSYVKAHQRVTKSGKVIHVDAHFDKRAKKGSEHAPDHGYNLDHLNKDDRAKFDAMHREQHLLHHYHRHTLDKKVKLHEAKKAGLEHLATAAELQGDKAKAENLKKQAAITHKALARHKESLKKITDNIDGIAKLKESMVAGSGHDYKDSTDSSHGEYAKKLDKPTTNDKSKPEAKTQGKLGEVEVLDDDVPVRWQLVDAADLHATIEKADNQFRDRTRASSEAQIAEMSNKLKFKLLNDSPVMDYGAPTLAKNGKTIIGGNGRALAIGKAYKNGKADQYKADLIANAKKFGFSKEAVEAMQHPVLIRVLQKDVDIKKAAIASNEGGGLKMSALEQAKVDGERLGDLSEFLTDDSGNINTPANRKFINHFIQSFPVNQQAAFQSKDGYLSQEGMTRLRNAVLYRAYGESDVLSRMAEATDPGQKNLLNALVKMAATIAKVKGGIKASALHNLDISADIVMAAHVLGEIKTAGTFKNADDYLKQLNVFDDPLSDEAKTLLSYFDNNLKSAKSIADYLGRYYDEVQKLGDPKQENLFGDTQLPKSIELLTQAKHDKAKQPETADLFGKSIHASRPGFRSWSKNRPRPAHQTSHAKSHASDGKEKGKRLILFCKQ